jgi:DNA-directed RNA polymerase subunit RPC12/RpoP
MTTIFVYYDCRCGETVPESMISPSTGELRCPDCGALLDTSDDDQEGDR